MDVAVPATGDVVEPTDMEKSPLSSRVRGNDGLSDGGATWQPSGSVFFRHRVLA